MSKKQKDNLHINFNKIDGYNKPFNHIISEREGGKSTEVWTKSERLYKRGMTTLVIRRQAVDITSVYIESIVGAIEDFLDYPIEIEYSKKDCKEGVVKIYRIERIKNDEGIVVSVEKKEWLLIVALSQPKGRLKSLVFKELGMIVFDEFIIDTRSGEKYLPNEVERFKELYTTFKRWKSESVAVLKAYFCGNPYSKYNPYFSDYRIDYSMVRQGCFLVGVNYCIWCYQLLPELKKKILEDNPLYQFDDSYKKYAFDGIAVNDENIRLEPKMPKNYFLRYVLVKDRKHYGVFENSDFFDNNYFWVGNLDSYSGKRKNIVAFDFNDLIEHTELLDKQDKLNLARFKRAVGKRCVTYQNIECAYICEEIYNCI